MYFQKPSQYNSNKYSDFTSIISLETVIAMNLSNT